MPETGMRIDDLMALMRRAGMHSIEARKQEELDRIFTELKNEMAKLPNGPQIVALINWGEGAMICYTCNNFKGIEPTCTAAIIFAENEALATLLLMEAIKNRSIDWAKDQKPSEWVFENHGTIDHVEGCEILATGDY